MHKNNTLILISLTLIFCPPLAAKTYRWTDESGTTTYSQQPPPSGVATEIKQPPPPAMAPTAAQRKLQQQKQQLEDLRENRELAKKARKKDHAEKTRQENNCTTAKNNLKALNRPHARWKTDGGFAHITEEERQSRIKKAKEQTKENCK